MVRIRKPEKVRRATAHDVARIAGVSQSAVSRAFTQGASISDEVRERVHAAAATLGYRPNLIARSLITRRSGIIGIAVSDLENQFYAAVLQSLSRLLAGHGYRLLLFTPPAGGTTDPIFDEILRHQVDAVVLVASLVNSRLADECNRLGVPVVQLNRRTRNAASSSVTVDNYAGGRALAELLVARGHRRCAFMAGLEDASTSRDREAGFVAGLAAAGQRIALRAVGHYEAEAARAATRDLLHAAEPPDAIFCANDHMAMAAIETARREFGLQVGRDLSVTGFDDVPLASWPSFDLTTYAQPVAPMVQRVVTLLLAHLHEGDTSPRQEVVQGTLRIRGSVRREP